MSEEKTLFKLNDEIYFRVCTFNDCTEKPSHWKEHIKECKGLELLNCIHEGDIHLHCPEHVEYELVMNQGTAGPRGYGLSCSKCGRMRLGSLMLQDVATFKQQARAAKNSKLFKGAKLIRLDDFYTPELQEKSTSTKDSDYWMSYDVKKTRDGKPLLVLYLGDRNDKSKIQFFIDPESKKLSHDHNDTEPLSVISRIEVEFKDGKFELKNKEQQQ